MRRIWTILGVHDVPGSFDRYVWLPGLHGLLLRDLDGSYVTISALPPV